MVPGLAIEEFSTPPTSPVSRTRTTRKTMVSTVVSGNLKIDTDLPWASDLQCYDMQLGKLIEWLLC